MAFWDHRMLGWISSVQMNKQTNKHNHNHSLALNHVSVDPDCWNSDSVALLQPM